MSNSTFVSTKNLRLNWLGSSIEVRTSSRFGERVVKILSVELEHFTKRCEILPSATITIVDPGRVLASQFSSGRLRFKFRGIKVKILKQGRAIFYPDGCEALLTNQLANQLTNQSPLDVKISAPSIEVAARRIYLLALSLLGEDLERKGFMRIHAASFAHDLGATAVLAPSGTGKSTLAAQILRGSSLNLYSDEITLLKNGTLYPFPCRMALKPPQEERISIPQNRIAVPTVLHKIYLATRVSEKCFTIQTLTTRRAASLIAQLTIGWHLPQLLEVALRRDSFFFLCQMLVRRLATALKLVILRKTGVLQLATNPPGEARERDFQELLRALSQTKTALNSESLTVRQV